MANRNDDRYRQGRAYGAGYDDRSEHGPYGGERWGEGETRRGRQELGWQGRQGWQGQSHDDARYGAHWERQHPGGPTGESYGGERSGRDWDQSRREWQGRPEWESRGGDWRGGGREWQGREGDDWRSGAREGQRGDEWRGATHAQQNQGAWRNEGGWRPGGGEDHTRYGGQDPRRSFSGEPYGQHHGQQPDDYRHYEREYGESRYARQGSGGYGGSYGQGAYGQGSYGNDARYGGAWGSGQEARYSGDASGPAYRRDEPQHWGGRRGQQGGVQGFFENVKEGVRQAFQGIKGYRRSDDRVREDVCDRINDLSRRHGIDVSELTVQVQDGEVTLTGTIDDRQHKHLVENAADSVSGVRDVHNQVRVRRRDEAASPLGAGAVTAGTNIGAGTGASTSTSYAAENGNRNNRTQAAGTAKS